MKILHTANTYPPAQDGVSEVVSQISERLARKGHEVHIATTWRPDRKVDSLGGVKMHSFRVRGNSANGMSGEIEAYRKFVLNEPWDIMVNHAARIWTTDALLDVVTKINCPKVFVAHGLPSYGSAFYSEYYNRFGEVMKQYDRIVGLSTINEDSIFCRDHCLHTPYIIPNGVSLDDWSCGTLGLRERWRIGARPWIVTIGNHSKQKAHHNYYKLSSLIKYLDTAISIIGNPITIQRVNLGPIKLMGGCFYRCLFSTAFVEKSVILHYAIPRREVISALKEADLMVLASNWEASPLVILESMAAGTPWVSFDIGCVREHVGGVVVKDIHEMAEVVCNLLRNPEKRKALGEEGRKRVLERHSWDMIADQYEALYQGLVDKKCQSRLS